MASHDRMLQCPQTMAVVVPIRISSSTVMYGTLSRCLMSRGLAWLSLSVVVFSFLLYLLPACYMGPSHYQQMMTCTHTHSCTSNGGKCADSMATNVGAVVIGEIQSWYLECTEPFILAQYSALKHWVINPLSDSTVLLCHLIDTVGVYCS